MNVVPIGQLMKELYEPLQKFLNIRNNLQDRVMMADLPQYEPVLVTGETKIEEAMNIVINKHIHRIYIVDQEGKPTGVMSVCDFIKFFNDVGGEGEVKKKEEKKVAGDGNLPVFVGAK